MTSSPTQHPEHDPVPPARQRRRPSARRALRALLLAAVLPLAGCDTVYYGTMEKFGVHKRDILVDRVEEAKESQGEAKEQFSSALEKFLDVTQFKGGVLQEKYETLNREFERSESKAAEVNARIRSIEEVAEDLFAEWEKELAQYSSSSLRRTSQRKLDETRRRYGEMIAVLRSAAARMDPVLDTFRDQVLFLKHNLNAQAVAALSETSAELQTEIRSLIAEMDRAIREADQFLRAMR